MEKTIRVDGMHCKSCETLLADVVLEVAGVSGVKIDRGKGTVTVRCDGGGSVESVRKAIEREGYRVV